MWSSQSKFCSALHRRRRLADHWRAPHVTHNWKFSSVHFWNRFYVIVKFQLLLSWAVLFCFVFCWHFSVNRNHCCSWDRVALDPWKCILFVSFELSLAAVMFRVELWRRFSQTVRCRAKRVHKICSKHTCELSLAIYYKLFCYYTVYTFFVFCVLCIVPIVTVHYDNKSWSWCTCVISSFVFIFQFLFGMDGIE